MIKKIKHYIYQIRNGRLTEIYTSLKWMSQYVRKHIFSISLYTLIGLSDVAISLFSSLVSRDLVDIITGHQAGELLKTFCLIIFAQLAAIVTSQISIYISTQISLKVDNSLKADIYDQIMITDWEALTSYHSGDLLVRWSGDVSAVSSGILNLAPNLIIYTVKFFSALFMVVRHDASFAIFALASVPLSLYISKRNLSRIQKSNMDNLTVNTKMSGFTQESFTNYQTIKAFDMIPLYSKRLRELQKSYSISRMKFQKVTSINSIILALMSILVTYSTYGWGIYKVWSGDISYGTLTMFLALSGTLSGTVQSLINLVPNTITLSNSARRLMHIISLPKEDYSQSEEVAQFFRQHQTDGVGLSIRDVSYTYATGTEVFENVSFDAHPHETIALVGPSGEGKTTMLRLLLSIIGAKDGAGYICPGNLTPESARQPISLTASTRQLFAYVPQGNTMFSGTIAENMRNVKEDATDEEIIEALKLACAWDFVEKLPDGIHTMMQERGGGFSEGQAQRLSIARALVRKSPILLLDEATSALDVYTEKKVLQNIMRDDYPRTTIVTTHRPSVLNVCTRVYAIRNKTCELLSTEEIDDMIHNF